MHEDRHPIGDRGTTRGQITLLYKLLADHQRRALLQYLRNTEAPMPISALVTALTQRDEHVSPDEPTNTEIAVHHIHLPKLADAGVIEYDQSAQQATYSASPQVDALLEEMLVTVSTGEQKSSLQE
ncbi:hypothetical protein BG842_07715 [Haladaptatus sp. W1]|uniref:DUF7344 domain-containing protein n=1 Tax=Haladaptatus sp. W1 TaxID=1897478 RepID=UPI000849E0C6|nr:hypothetical protein [Haladaptatus sp. W1]ODR80338.1 hypothetical protein BG842_07715 [Haladaptatus sp. W1]